MNYNRRLRKVYSTGERGIALFFALGILAVIMITVLVFANRANTDRKIASAYASSGQAQGLAESALNRALVNLTRNAAGSDHFYSADTGNNTDTFDWLWKIGTTDYPLGSRNAVRWQYIKDQDPAVANDDNQKILGRFAYRIFGLNPLNLNALLTHDNLCNGTSCDGTGKCSQHLGRSVAELSFYPDIFKLENAEGASVTFNKNKLMEQGTTYSTIDMLKAAFGVDNYGSGASLEEYFLIADSDALNEPDAFFAYDANSNNSKDKEEYYHRFNLNRTDWNTLNISDVAKDAVAFYASDGVTATANTTGLPWFKNWSDQVDWETAEEKKNQIVANFLQYCSPTERAVISDKPANTWNATVIPAYAGNKRTAYLNEMMVNLGVQASYPATPAEKVIDENTTHYQWSPLNINVTLYLQSEAIKMYKTLINDDCKIKFYGSITFDYQKNNRTFANMTADPTTATHTITLSGSEELEAMDSDWSDGYINFSIKSGENNYITQTLDAGSYASATKTIDPKELFKISNLKVNIKLVLESNGENVDYANLLTDKTDIMVGDGTFDTAMYYPFQVNAQANDPRHNLREQDWHITYSDQSATLMATDTLGACNSGLTLTAGVTDGTIDTELVTDPAWRGNAKDQHISTAYIRHAHMESLWELGAIHRAAPWQTINLKVPQSVPSTGLDFQILSKGGGAYAESDYLLLEQTTFQADNKVIDKFGKININAVPSPIKNFTLDALFRDMPFHTDGYYDADDSGTAKTTLNDNTAITEAARALNHAATAGVMLYRRTDVYQAGNPTTANGVNYNFQDLFTAAGIPGLELNTDALQEQLIGRTINLTKANTNFDSAVAVVIAQSIQDVGGGVEIPVDWGNSTELRETNAGFRQYGSGQNTSAAFGGTVSFSDKPKGEIGTYQNGLDKITGTAKMSAYLIYDNNTAQWKLVRVKNEE